MIIKVPDWTKNYKGRQKVEALSRFARRAACLSSFHSGSGKTMFEKDLSGIPKPYNGIHWSITHKPDYVAGVVSNEPVGIDIERIKPVSDTMFKKLVHDDEKMQFDCLGNHINENILFFRLFTAKESVLKKTGIGIKGLSRIKICSVIDKTHLIVKFEGENYLVEHFYLDDHIVSVTKDLFDVRWKIEK